MEQHSSQRKVRKNSGPFGHEWRDYALCLGKITNPNDDPWYPENDDTIRRPPKEAFNICVQCPVRQDCLLEAIRTNEQHGIWGGLTRKQRVSLCRPRDRVKCPICFGTMTHAMRDRPMQACLSCGITWRAKQTPQ